MIALIKAEFRKLFTVRSTYLIVFIAFFIVTLGAFYADGIKGGANVGDPMKLSGEVISAITVAPIFAAIIALLLFAHEYRYNTIMYTLASSNSRTKTLLAKIIAVTGFAVVFSVLISVYSPLMTYLGLHIKGYVLVPQTIYYADLLWKVVFTGWGYAMLGLLLAALLRNQVAAIVALFIIPSTIEPLLGILLKSNAIYLPFTALRQVTNTASSPPPSEVGIPFTSPGKGALICGMYLVIGWVIAWLLFLRKDAN